LPESSKKTRVLHVSVGLEIGGAEVLLTRFLPQLDSSKYDVTVCGLKKWGIIGNRLTESGIKVIALEGSGKFSVGVLFKLFNLIRKNRYDIVQSHLFLANFASAIVILLLKLFSPGHPLLFIVTSHEIGDWQKWFHNLGEKFYYSLADRVVCCSQAVKVSKIGLFRLSGDKCEVIYNGISLPEDSSKEKAERNRLEVRKRLGWNDPSLFLIGTVGRLDNRAKGFNYLIRAVSSIEKEINCRLLIIGSGPDQKSLAELISELHLRDKIKIIEDMNPSKMIAGVDLFVLPSNSEGFGIVLLEAMALNIPVVSTFVGGIPEVILNGETGILIWPRDSGSLSRAIKYVKEHPYEANQMVQNGRKRLKENFTLDLVVKKTEVLYETLLQERTPCAE
jgi:glycosyltransferase involved in cell wall biosynthesis